LILPFVFLWQLFLLNSLFCSFFLFTFSFLAITHSMFSLSALQQCLFELHGMSSSANCDTQIAVLFSDIQQLMQLFSTTISVSTTTTSVPVETPAPTPIYSNVLSHTVVANLVFPPVLPRAESLLSSHSSTIASIKLTLIPGPEESASALPVLPSPIQPPVAPATLSPIYSTFPYFYSYPSVF